MFEFVLACPLGMSSTPSLSEPNPTQPNPTHPPRTKASTTSCAIRGKGGGGGDPDPQRETLLGFGQASLSGHTPYSANMLALPFVRSRFFYQGCHYWTCHSAANHQPTYLGRVGISVPLIAFHVFHVSHSFVSFLPILHCAVLCCMQRCAMLSCVVL